MPLPFVIGRDLVGTVAETGPAVTGFSVGDRAWCNSLGYAGRQGAAARRALVTADRLYRLPAGVPAADAVAVAQPAATAYLGLFTHGRLRVGETVVVVGAGGNVGSALVLMAARAGARVIAVAGAAGEERVRALGAEVFVDYRDPRAAERIREAAPSGVDVYVDTPARNDLPTAVDLLARRGRIVLLTVHTGCTFEARYRPQGTIAKLVPSSEPVAIHVLFVHSRVFTALPISILQGHPVIILREDDPEVVAELFRQVPPGLIEAHPNTFLRWEELAGDPRAPLAKVKYFSSTFDAIHPRTVHRLLSASRRKGAKFVQMYGQSEVGPIAGRTYSPKRGAEAEGRCVGRGFPGMTAVRVVSRDGNPPTKFSPGFIEVKSNGRIVTYLGEHERWEKQADGDWWRMGDVGYRTKWGCPHLLDREVDEIPGIDITLEIEDKLFARLPELTEVVIVPGPDGRPVPVVSTRGDQPLDPVAWKSAVVDLPQMADPVQWRLEDLPRTATTKVKRLELLKRLQSRG